MDVAYRRILNVFM